MKKTCIRAFIIMSVLMTVLLILSYMLIGIVFRFLALMVMVVGFVFCLRTVSAEGLTLKTLGFSLLSSVGAMAVSIFLSRAAVIGLFMLG
ncbi:MAG: hypothetical protein E7497_05365 [Ruminococcus sp.]|nr:hypothetical protein [Ruminococcus sp.]